jgi:hypothetical protein
MRRLLPIFLVALAILLSGCGAKNSPSNDAQLRYFNTSPDLGSLDIQVGGNLLQSGLAFQGITSYKGLTGGTGLVIAALTAGTTTTVTSATGTLSGGSRYTAIFSGTQAAPGTNLLADDTTTPAGGNFKLRAVGMAPGAPGFDLYVTSPTADIASTGATILNIAYRVATDYTAEQAAGQLRLRLTVAGTKEVIFDSGTITLAEKSAYTLVAFTSGSGQLVSVALLLPNDSGSSVVYANTFSRFKSLVAVADATLSNFVLDGATQLSNIPFGGISSYLTTAAGAHVERFDASAAPGAGYTQAATPLQGGTDYTIIGAGTFANARTLVLTDYNLPPSTGRARVRFVNASPDTASVDVLVNFQKQASALALDKASAYLEFDAGVSYTIAFNTAGTSSPLLTLTPVELDAGNTYSIHLVGTGTNAKGVVVRDD